MMLSAPLDHPVELPCSKKPVQPLVFGRLMGFEVKALRAMGVYAATEMGWRASVGTPAYGYLFTEQRPVAGDAGLGGGDFGDAHSPRTDEVDAGCTQIVGAAFFARDLEEDVAAEWFMTGVWLHPLARGKGHFIEALPEMEAKFGDFAICGPYSPAFQRLMEKHPEIRSHTLEHMLPTS